MTIKSQIGIGFSEISFKLILEFDWKYVSIGNVLHSSFSINFFCLHSITWQCCRFCTFYNLQFTIYETLMTIKS